MYAVWECVLAKTCIQLAVSFSKGKRIRLRWNENVNPDLWIISMQKHIMLHASFMTMDQISLFLHANFSTSNEICHHWPKDYLRRKIKPIGIIICSIRTPRAAGKIFLKMLKYKYSKVWVSNLSNTKNTNSYH